MLVKVLTIAASRPENRHILSMIHQIFVYSYFVEMGILGIYDLIFTYTAPFYQFHSGDGVSAIWTVATFENP